VGTPLFEVEVKSELEQACPVCYEDDFDLVVHLKVCGHKVCLKCWREDVLYKLNNKMIGWNEEAHSYSVKCYVGTCMSMHKDHHLLQLLGKHQYNRFKEFAFSSLVTKEEAFVVCPLPRCGEVCLQLCFFVIKICISVYVVYS
jgi:hypothetical protein